MKLKSDFILPISVLLFALAPVISSASKHASLSERVNALKEIFNKRHVIKFTDSSFKEYVRSPRNYSFVIMFTAMASYRQCSICNMVNEEFMVAVKSFRHFHGVSDQVFFGIVDFDSAGEIFQYMKLSTAPVIIYFPPKGKPEAEHTLDMQRFGFSAEVIARFITDKTGLEFRIIRPPSYLGTVLAFAAFAVVAMILYLRQENLEYIKNKTFWAIFLIGFALLMTSGQMWNHIRQPPLFYRHPNGHTTFIHNSSQGQLISETYIVFVLNVSFVASVISVIEFGFKNTSDNSKTRKMLCLGSVAIGAFVFSLILSIFKAKAGGYPYRGLF